MMKTLSKPTAALRIAIVRGTYIYFVLVFAAATALGLLAPILLEYLVGKAYQSAGDLVVYIAFGFAFGGCYYMVTNYIFFESNTKLLAFVTFFSGFANIPLMFILVGHNGLAGAGQAFLLTQAMTFLGTWWLSQKVHPMPWLQALRLNAK